MQSVIEVSEKTFQQDVIERSKQVPVVVDFWAEWCGPCRVLGPVLEKLAAEYAGAFILAKLDVDQNPRLAQQYRVQGIPAVKAFRHGRVANEFVGALPEPRVREFLRALIPNEADRLAAQGAAAEGKNDLPAALEAYQAALELQADHAPALLGLGRVWLAQGEVDQAEEVLTRVPLRSPQTADADRLRAQARLQAEATRLGNEAELVAKLAANPNGSHDGLGVKLALGKLRIGQGRYADGLELLLDIVRADRGFQEGAARKALIDTFLLLGDEDPLTMLYRRQLSNLLF